MSQADILDTCTSSDLFGRAFRELCMSLIGQVDGYDWSGVYRLEGDSLILDAFDGAPTTHDRIQVGEGVCGSAVAMGINQVVDDVSGIDNYLSCSLDTKSEIVVLIRSRDKILGQIDIDSHSIARFKLEDSVFLESLAGLIADRWAEDSQP